MMSEEPSINREDFLRDIQAGREAFLEMQRVLNVLTSDFATLHQRTYDLLTSWQRYDQEVDYARDADEIGGYTISDAYAALASRSERIGEED